MMPAPYREIKRPSLFEKKEWKREIDALLLTLAFYLF